MVQETARARRGRSEPQATKTYPKAARGLFATIMAIVAVTLGMGACGPSEPSLSAENIGSTSSALYSELKIWDNALLSSFTDGSYGMSSSNTCDTSKFTTSTCSYQATFAANQWGAYQFILSAGFSTQNYSYLEFTMHLNGQPLSDFEVRLAKLSDNSEIPVPAHTLSSGDVVATYGNGFQRFRVPVSAINPNNDAIRKVIIKSTQASALSPVWLDEMRFWGGCDSSADTSQLNFECGTTHNMSYGTGVTSIDWSTANAYAGAYSLETRFSGTVSRPDVKSVTPNTLPSGSFTLTAHIFVPVGSAVTRAQVFAQEGASGGWLWWGQFANVTAGSWQTLTTTVNATTPLNSIGVEFDVTSAGWTGSAYIDAISWTTCSDGVKNGAETDIDCGGGTCGTCANGKTCLVNTDCTSGSCSNGTCQAVAGTRSAMYPANWTPGYKDQGLYYLQDYSYAGYHNGLEPPTDDTGKYFQDVLTTDGRAQIQTKINNIATYLDNNPSTPGGVLRFPAGTFNIALDGTNRLTITHSKIVLRGAGYGSTFLRITDTATGDGWAGIKFGGNANTSGEYFLAADGGEFDTSVLVSSSGLVAGDDIVIGWKITDAFRDDHGVPHNYWCNDNVNCSGGPFTWAKFFRRKVVSVVADGSNWRVTLDVPLRYAVKTRDSASVRKVTGLISECGLENLSISDTAGSLTDSDATSWTTAHASNQRSAVEFNGVKDCWMRNVRSYQTRTYSQPSANTPYHLRSHGVHLANAKRVTVRNCVLESSQNRTALGNGYLYHLEGANEILIRGSSALHGRHGFLTNWAFGHSGNVFLDSRSAYSQENGGTGASPSWSNSSSDFHHPLAMANLIDRTTIDDEWTAYNRGVCSNNAYITSTQNVFWNCSGTGTIESKQYGQGYIVGAASSLTLDYSNLTSGSCGGGPVHGAGTSPADHVELTGVTDLNPSSLYCDQLAKRGLSCPP